MSRRIAGVGVIAALMTGASAVVVIMLGITAPTPESAAVAGAQQPAQAAGGAAFPVEADYCFVEAMIPHHEQALELSALVLGADDARERTRALAEFIERDQSTEIDTMRGWQDAWAQAVPTTEAAASGHSSHDSPAAAASGDIARGCGAHNDHSAMKGMATPEQLALLGELAVSDGPAADRMFLQLMIVHHEGALEMATLAVTEGSNRFVRSSAKHVLIEQAREIAAMNALLADAP